MKQNIQQSEGKFVNMKKSFVARKSGKKQKQQQATEHVDASQTEQAATLQESSEDPIPVLAKEDKPYPKNKTGKNNRFSHFKPVIIAIVSATVIGSVLGFVMLRMFVGIDHELAAPSPNSLPTAAVNADEDKQQQEAEAKPITIESMNAYALQGGVFSEKANADKWAEKFTDAGMSSMVWEQDEQYYLFLGLTEEKEQAKNLVATTKESSDYDVFVKEWSTDKVEVEMSGEEQKWFQSFQDQWAKSLAGVNKEKALLPADWEPIAASYPKESERGKDLVDAISKVEETTGTDAQITLLNLWNAYDQSLK